MTHEEKQKMKNQATKGEIATNIFLYLHEEKEDPNFKLTRVQSVKERLECINLTLEDLNTIIEHYNKYDVNYLININKAIRNIKK